MILEGLPSGDGDRSCGTGRLATVAAVNQARNSGLPISAVTQAAFECFVQLCELPV